MSFAERMRSAVARLRDRLMPFQREGVDFGLAAGGRVLIADEMGLGKTVQAIALAASFAEDWPLLVVCPASLRYVWAAELEKWLPELPVSAVHVAKGRADTAPLGTCRVAIVTYSLLTNGSPIATAVDQAGFRAVILDESHNIKTHDSQRTKLLMPVLERAARLIMLSGTPALARPVELWPQVAPLAPDVFGTFRKFTERFCNAHRGRFGWDVSGASNTDELHRLLSRVMVRRLKSAVLTQLPSKRRQIIAVDPSAQGGAKEDARRAMAALVSKRIEVNDFFSGSGASGDFSDARRANHEAHSLVMEAYQATGRAKAEGAATFIADTLAGGADKIIVFAHHKAVMDALESAAARMKELKSAGSAATYIRIDGSTPPSERHRLVELFQRERAVRVALLSMTAAGTGLTLTAASTVVFAELHWTPGVLAQAEDRAHRIGQKSAVNVYYLLLSPNDRNGSLDPGLWSALSRKVKCVGEALDGQKNASLGAESGGEVRSGESELQLFFADQHNGRGASADAAAPKPIPPGDIRSFFGGGKGKAKAKAAAVIDLVDQQPDAARAASGATPASSPKRWECAACTFENAPDARACAMCRGTCRASASGAKELPSGGPTHPRAAVAAPAEDELRRAAAERVRPTLQLSFCVSGNTGRIAVYLDATDSDLSARSRADALASFDPADVWRDGCVQEAALHEAIAHVVPTPAALDEAERALRPPGEAGVAATRSEETGAVVRLALAKELATFLAEWASLRPIEQQRLSNRALRAPVRAALATLAPAGAAACFDRGVDAPRKRSMSTSAEATPGATAVSDDASGGAVLHIASSALPGATPGDGTSDGGGQVAKADEAAGEAHLCKWCEAPLPEAHDTSGVRFCCLDCCIEFAIRKPHNSSAVRRQLFALEHGICRTCGLDAHSLYLRCKALTPPERLQLLLGSHAAFLPKSASSGTLLTAPVEGDFWQADHVLPVAEGGGCCSLENFRTLCTPCHRRETDALRDRLKERKRATSASGTADIRALFSKKARSAD